MVVGVASCNGAEISEAKFQGNGLPDPVFGFAPFPHDLNHFSQFLFYNLDIVKIGFISSFGANGFTFPVRDNRTFINAPHRIVKKGAAFAEHHIELIRRPRGDLPGTGEV